METTLPQRKVSVVIPIYKSTLPEKEGKVLRHNLEILSQHHIVILVPDDLDLEWLNREFDVESKYTIQRVSDEWLGRKNGIAGYNRMLMSAEFYDLFSSSEYILICQTDAYIFRDELLYWCDKGYDYIGAPWLRKAIYYNPIIKFYLKVRKFFHRKNGKFIRQDIYDRVGNGGLSLRRVSSHRAACVKYRDRIELTCKSTHNLDNEDVFWALIPEEFRYPDYHEALGFSIDVKPELCMKEAGGKLPFGCHGIFYRKKYPFWRDKLNLE